MFVGLASKIDLSTKLGMVGVCWSFLSHRFNARTSDVLLNRLTWTCDLKMCLPVCAYKCHHDKGIECAKRESEHRENSIWVGFFVC